MLRQTGRILAVKVLITRQTGRILAIKVLITRQTGRVLAVRVLITRHTGRIPAVGVFITRQSDRIPAVRVSNTRQTGSRHWVRCDSRRGSYENHSSHNGIDRGEINDTDVVILILRYTDKFIEEHVKYGYGLSSLDPHSKHSHNIIHGTLNIGIPRPPPFKREIWDYQTVKIDLIRADLLRVNWHDLFFNLKHMAKFAKMLRLCAVDVAIPLQMIFSGCVNPDMSRTVGSALMFSPSIKKVITCQFRCYPFVEQSWQ